MPDLQTLAFICAIAALIAIAAMWFIAWRTPDRRDVREAEAREKTDGEVLADLSRHAGWM